MSFKSKKQRSWEDEVSTSNAKTYLKKRQDIAETGGTIFGNSHDEGGIPIEAEGGEFIIKKDSVKKIEKKHGKKFLEKLNEFGGVPVTNAKERSKKVYE